MEYHYDTKWLLGVIDKEFIGITPNKIPEKMSAIVPEAIWGTMTSNVQKDIEEMFTVYCHEQWTATTMMVYRILEEVLRVHVEYDLGEDAVRNLGNSIKVLRERGYPESLINGLEYCRGERNSIMHGTKRASSADAKKMIGYVMSIALQIYNIKPRSRR